MRTTTDPCCRRAQHLHILSSQLILLKSTLTPLQLLLQALRSQDDAKAAAAAKIDPSPAPTRSASPTGERANNVRVQRRGFVSHEARLYLSDVMDHMDSTLSSLDLFSDLAENLVRPSPLYAVCVGGVGGGGARPDLLGTARSLECSR